MKNTRQPRLQWFAVVDRCLQWFGKPSSTTINGAQRPQQPSTTRRAGYTLIEVLAAGAIVSVGATAMVSLSSTLMLQEEFATRVAITRNHQENMVRLWQLGLSPVQILALMPSQSQNALLQQAVHGTPALIETGITTINDVEMETSVCTASVNISQDPRAETEGASFTLTAYRPRLVTDLRPPPP